MPRQLNKNEWLKTPYARSEATDPDNTPHGGS